MRRSSLARLPGFAGRSSPVRRGCGQQRRRGCRSVELVARGHVPGIAAAYGRDVCGPGRLVLGKGQGLGVGDGEDGDPLVGAAMLADDRLDAPVGDLAGGGQLLLALPRGARVAGDAGCQRRRQARRRRCFAIAVVWLAGGQAVPVAGGVDSGELPAELGLWVRDGRHDGGDQQDRPHNGIRMFGTGPAERIRRHQRARRRRCVPPTAAARSRAGPRRPGPGRPRPEASRCADQPPRPRRPTPSARCESGAHARPHGGH
jgi:hypothetical protein